MSEPKLPTRVPLPEVPHYSEDIVFGALGLPVGFDQSRLLVSLRSFDRIRKVAGLETVSVFAASHEPELHDAGISSVSDSGVATVGLAGKRRKKPIMSASLDYGGSNLMGIFCKPDVAIKVNNAEIEARIEESGKYQKGVFDPQARARFLNRAVIRGLSEANFSASFSQSRFLLSAGSYGPIGLNATLSHLPILPVEAVPAFGVAIELFVYSGWAKSISTNRQEMKQLMRQGRYSMFMGFTPDRYIAGGGLIAASKLIRARK
jgi:hypothetical protein